MTVRFLPAGDRGLVVEFGNAVSPAINAQVRALDAGLAAARIHGVVETVPTYRSLGIEYDSSATSSEALQARVREVLANLDPGVLPPPKRVRIPTVYGGEYGPDLPFVAEHAGLREAEVIRLHAQTVYHVYMIGFAAGFAYLGGLPERLHTPRLPSPRIRVPKGSVGIGGNQTGAYPAETPGGWRLIGRTYLGLFDPSQEIPTPMVPGDEVEFMPISEAEFLAASHEPRATSREPRGSRRKPGAEGRGGGRESDDMSQLDQCDTGLAVRGSRLGFEVLRSGLLTTVQDRGRTGYQRFGVPVSGAVDQLALRVGNVLVGNQQDAAVLEIALQGPKLRLLADLVLALTGAEIAATLDEEPVPWYESFVAHRGQVLDIQGVARGLRAYLSVAGGIDVPIVLRSRSTCLVARFGGFHGRALHQGDVLPIGRPARPLERLIGWAAPESWRQRYGSPVTLRVVWGPQDDAFSEEGRRTFLESTYEVTPHADRMGCRLDGPRIAHRDSADIISDWIPPGGIQVPGDGRPIILLMDRQTTGGYAKIATVIGPDIGLVAQCRPGDALRFHAIPLAEAHGVAKSVEAGLAELPAHLIDTETWSRPAALGEVPGAIRMPCEERAGQSAGAKATS